MSLPDVPLRQATPVALEYLHFDLENPRFSSEAGLDTRNDIAVIRNLYSFADLGELVQSIATSGYVDIEPFVVMEERGRKWFVVLEGNRRLAALRLLTVPEFARSLKITLPNVQPNVAASFEAVSVYRVNTREDARDFIGFKHINGPQRWDSLAKAQFAANWYRDERASGVTLRDIAQRMGDRHDTIQRMVMGIYVLNQAEEQNLFHVDDRFPGRRFSFSHLYTALARPDYRRYLGLNADWRSTDPTPNPISGTANLKKLGLVMRWLYGSKSDAVRPVVTVQNPGVRELGEVLENAKARTVLESSNDLPLAYAEVFSQADQFEKCLVEARQQAQSALGSVSGYEAGNITLTEIAKELLAASQSIVDLIKIRNERAQSSQAS